MKINFSKCKVITSSEKRIILEDKELETVRGFCFLGSIGPSIERDVSRRMSLASAAFGELRNGMFYNRSISGGKTAVQNCIGGHVNVLSDYKKTSPLKILKLFHSNYHHLIDMLTKCCQNHIPPALSKRLDVRCPSIFTKIAMYSCAHVVHSRKCPINPINQLWS